MTQMWPTILGDHWLRVGVDGGRLWASYRGLTAEAPTLTRAVGIVMRGAGQLDRAAGAHHALRYTGTLRVIHTWPDGSTAGEVDQSYAEHSAASEALRRLNSLRAV